VEQTVVVGVAGCEVAATPGQVLTTYALGSCIGLAVYDPAAQVGGLLHFLLPDSAIDPARVSENPYRYGDTGVPALIGQVCRRGGVVRRLVACAAGAARMMGDEGMFDIGRRNYLALRRALWKTGVLLSGEAVGGAVPRTMRLEIGTGRSWVETAGEVQDLLAATARKE
jgi:chemotaxis protein CheD